MFILGFASLSLFGSYMYESITEIFMFNLTMFDVYLDIMEPVFIGKYVTYMFTKVILTIAPMLLVSMIIGITTNIIQVGWKVTAKPIQPKFSKLNPLTGFKRMFSLKALVELVKSVLKFGIILGVVYNTVKDYIAYLPNIFLLQPAQILSFLGGIIIDVGISVGAAFIIIAIIDYAYVKFKHEKDLKMTKQEVKEEYKQQEGNPEIKGKIRQKMREASMRRMMQDLPQADVIITNPTHYAVAIKYSKDSGKAPIVVAKGIDFLAKKIKEVAIENNIEIVEDKPLARTLYANVDINKEIPPELYKAVAEILAYVYKLKEKIV